MRFITKRLVLVLIVHACLATVRAREELNAKAIDEYVESKTQLARIPGMAVAIVKGDEVVYLKGYGRADPAGRPLTPQTPLILGSVVELYEPDLYYWVNAVAIVLFVKGVIEIAMISSVFRRQVAV